MGLIGGTKAAAAASRLLSLSVPRPLWGLKEDLECGKSSVLLPSVLLYRLSASRSRGLTMICGDEISTKVFFWGGARYVGGGEAGRGRSGRMEGFEKKARKEKFTRGEGLS